MSETTQITNQNQQKIDFRKIIHMHFAYFETFRPTYIFYQIEDVYRIFVARSRRGRIVAIHVAFVNYAFMRTKKNNLAIDVIYHYYAPGNNMPGGEITDMVRINHFDTDEKDDITIIKYNRNGEDREIVASNEVIKFLGSLIYSHEILAIFDAIINYT